MADEETEEHKLAWSGGFGEAGPEGGGIMTFENGDSFEGMYEAGKRSGATREYMDACTHVVHEWKVHRMNN